MVPSALPSSNATQAQPPAERKKLEELVEKGWAEALKQTSGTIGHLGNFLRDEVNRGHKFTPEGGNILKAFTLPLEQVKVLLVGQDPYPTAGHAMGLSFSVTAQTRPLPPSLKNIYQELYDDLGIAPAATGDLTPWFRQGVLLLNRVLTTRIGEPGAHRNQGWEQVTDLAIEALVSREKPLVAILWGRDAQNLKPRLHGAEIIESAHPSPLSAHRGFFGSRPFSRTNRALENFGYSPINWDLGRCKD